MSSHPGMPTDDQQDSAAEAFFHWPADAVLREAAKRISESGDDVFADRLRQLIDISAPRERAEPPPAELLALFNELEIVLYGKSGNTWEVTRAERIMDILRRAALHAGTTPILAEVCTPEENAKIEAALAHDGEVFEAGRQHGIAHAGTTPPPADWKALVLSFHAKAAMARDVIREENAKGIYGNDWAFLKEARVWREAADAVAKVLAGTPPPDAPETERT